MNTNDSHRRNLPEPEGSGAYEYEYVSDPHADGIMSTVMRFKWALIAILAVLAVVSAWPLREFASTPETYAATIETLDAKKDTVLSLTAASAATSAAISAIPGDAGTPIAEKLMDLSADFMIVLAAIYLEKYLLTTLGFVACTFLFPGACALLVIALLTYGRTASSGTFARLSAKLVLLGAVLVFTVPSSVFLTNQIEATFDDSISATVEKAEAVAEGAQEAEDEGEGGILDFIASIPETIGNGISTVTTGAQELVNNFIESLAIMLVASCAIPILVLLFFLWAANFVLGISVEAPMRAIRPRTLRGKAK